MLRDLDGVGRRRPGPMDQVDDEAVRGAPHSGRDRQHPRAAVQNQDEQNRSHLHVNPTAGAAKPSIDREERGQRSPADRLDGAVD